MAKQNYFPTLNEALESEGLLEAWDGAMQSPVGYGETRTWTWEDGTRYGHFCSVYRDGLSGRYERPVHYKR